MGEMFILALECAYYGWIGLDNYNDNGNIYGNIMKMIMIIYMVI